MVKLLRCTGCGTRVQRPLNHFEELELLREGGVTHFCSECFAPTKWRSPGEEVRDAASARKRFSQGVLLIGDNLPLMRGIQDVVERCGADAEFAFSFDDAVTRLVRQDFDLIVCEHRPPTFDAAAILKFMKTHRPECVSQVSFVAGTTASAEDLRNLTQSGAVCWSAKQVELVPGCDDNAPSAQLEPPDRS